MVCVESNSNQVADKCFGEPEQFKWAGSGKRGLQILRFNNEIHLLF